MFEIKKEPRIEITDLIAGGFILIGFLMFLVALHILSINTVGNTSAVLVTTFKVALRIYITLAILSIAAIIIQLLRWLTWSVTLADWQKKEERSRR